MSELDPASYTDIGTPRHVFTDQKIPLELGQVPQEFVQMVEDAYTGIAQKLQAGGRVKAEEVPTRPAMYICKKEDLETMNTLIGSKPFPVHHFVGALYFTVPHAIFIPREDMEKRIASQQLGKLKSTVYEEMIHALTTHFEEASQTLRTGFMRSKPVDAVTAEKIRAGRKPKEVCDFYEWSIVFAGTPPKRDYSKDQGAVYREDETHTENATHLAKYLMIKNPDTVINTGQFTAGGAHPTIKVIAGAQCVQYQDEYKIRSGGRDIASDILSALSKGEVQMMDDIADAYYKMPSSPIRAAASAVRFLTKPTDRLAFQLRMAIHELKNPKSFVFSTSPVHTG